MSCERPSHIIPSGRPERGQMVRVSSGKASSMKSWPNQRCGSMTVTRVPVMLFKKKIISLFVFLFSTGTIKLLFFFIQISTTGEKSGNNEHTPIQSRLRESPNPSPTFVQKWGFCYTSKTLVHSCVTSFSPQHYSGSAQK